MNDTSFSRVLRSENMIMVYFQCFKVKLTLKGRVKLFLSFALNDLNLQFLTSGDLKWPSRLNSHSLFYFWGSHEYTCQKSCPWVFVVNAWLSNKHKTFLSGSFSSGVANFTYWPIADYAQRLFEGNLPEIAHKTTVDENPAKNLVLNNISRLSKGPYGLTTRLYISLHIILVMAVS